MGILWLIDGRFCRNETLAFHLPPPNSEVAAQPKAPLENRASQLSQEWEVVEPIERVTSSQEKLAALDSSRATVGDLMSRVVLTATPATGISEALELMLESGFHHLPVVDDDQRLVGMVSDRDLLGRPGVLSDFMTPRVLTASPDTSLQRASEALAKQRFHSLVVVNDKRRPVGLLTSCDLLNFLVGHPAMRLWRQG